MAENVFPVDGTGEKLGTYYCYPDDANQKEDDEDSDEDLANEIIIQ